MRSRPGRRLATTARVGLFVLSIPFAASAQDASAARRDDRPTHAVGADFTYTNFADKTLPWRLASVSATRRGDFGSIIGRVNYADRFGTTGLQLEGDAYPRLDDKTYLYLNAGFSSASVFPDWRFGGEAFRSLPNAWEASLGFRQLRFGGAPVTMFTGTVGKYIGNYWLSLRPYIRQKDGGLSTSAGLTARRYFEDGDHWIGAAASFGSSPTDRLTPDAVGRTNAWSMSVNGSTGLAKRLLGTWSLSRDNEELAPGRHRDSFSISAGVKLAY